MNNLTVVVSPRNPSCSREASLEVASVALAARSADEMLMAAGLGTSRPLVRRAAHAVFIRLSRKLGATLARFDADVDDVGVSAAARRALGTFGASVAIGGPPPPGRGPLLVIANHPGAYDALALMAAIGRDDLAIVAADRAFLRALPRVSARLLFVGDAALGRDNAPAAAQGARRALRHLRRGGALLHFGAGAIEPDPAFTAGGDPPLGPWRVGTGALVRAAARAGGLVAAAAVAGVHSARAKRSALVRAAEARGITTLAPLLQVALPGFGAVRVEVALGEALAASTLASGARSDAELAQVMRERVLELLVPGARSSSSQAGARAG